LIPSVTSNPKVTLMPFFKTLLAVLLLFTVAGDPRPNLSEEGYCTWSAYGCNYFAIVSDTLCCALAFINCGDGWVEYGEGAFGGCPV
jgi:hypothetical protein